MAGLGDRAGPAHVAGERLNCPVHSILRHAGGVELCSTAGVEHLDRLVLACHSDQALRLLGDANEREHSILGAMSYQANDTVLHTDASVLPRRRKAWAAWNAWLPRDPGAPCTVSYCMNLLQGVASPKPLVTLNQQPVRQAGLDRDGRGDRCAVSGRLFPQARQPVEAGGPGAGAGDHHRDHRYAQALKSVDFIKRHVFPGSFIPSISALLAAKTRASDLSLIRLEDFGSSYAQTLKAWRERFTAHLAQVRAQGFDERFVRLWEFYLAYCEGGFRERSIGVAHLLMAKPGHRPAAPSPGRPA
ncbi:hypothetical protein RLIN73S_00006 [Rhodanobacter lindaniclasticus]